MKKLMSNLFVACLGGFIAIGATHFLYENKSQSLNRVTEPNETPSYKLTNYSGVSSAGNADFTMAAEKSLYAVVHIKTTSERVNNLAYDPFAEWFFGQQKRQQSYIQQGSGSGVIISQDGYIVTNNHVINGADKIEITLNDKRTYEAKVIGTDASTDVALLKIEEKNLPYLLYGNSDAVKVGEWVLAVGNPFNLNSTVTAGIISAKGRNNIIDNNKRPIESFIQTDAAVNPGNSGGALVNTDGELIGINTAIASNNGAYQGYSFAVPVNIVKKIVSDMVEFGTVQRAYMGVSIRDIDSKFAAEKNIKQLKGVYVISLNEGGSAQDAGIEEGDVITKIQNVEVGSLSELQEQVSKFRPGDKISVSVIRADKEKTVSVTLKALDNTTKLIKKSDVVSKTTTALGADFEEVDNELLARYGAENGVRISQIRAGRLSLVGIKKGFIITGINKQKVLTTNDVKNILEREKGTVVIEGFYQNGMRASYSFML
ncbi:MAG: Do family serine endopeptidase [Bacteroidetes bacterium]|nr:Do family serine endopeptidase [Bacteroidota bacterium]